jgi:hypothetical protein
MRKVAARQKTNDDGEQRRKSIVNSARKNGFAKGLNGRTVFVPAAKHSDPAFDVDLEMKAAKKALEDAQGPLQKLTDYEPEEWKQPKGMLLSSEVKSLQFKGNLKEKQQTWTTLLQQFIFHEERAKVDNGNLRSAEKVIKNQKTTIEALKEAMEIQDQCLDAINKICMDFETQIEHLVEENAKFKEAIVSKDHRKLQQLCLHPKVQITLQNVVRKYVFRGTKVVPGGDGVKKTLEQCLKWMKLPREVTKKEFLENYGEIVRSTIHRGRNRAAQDIKKVCQSK